MSRVKQIAFLLVLAAAATAGWLAFALAVPYRGFAGEGIFVEIPRGTPVRGIARLLAERGVVRSAAAFELLCRWRGRALQAGEYRFDRAKTAFSVQEDLAEGRVFTQAFVVPEGYSILDVADLVAERELAPREEFLAAASDLTFVSDIAPAARSLEGFLFPATYQFPRRAAAREIVAAMVRRFRAEWASLGGDGRLPQRLALYEVVTMASLVEKETRLAEERPLVAGVFYNRLKRGLALQCDPTVIYALRLAGRYRGTLLTRDLALDSPYNTYRRRGLPPGPIANPGAAALQAALAPPATEYLYFVADAQGGHVFARTLAEHNANVARYRRLQSEAARAQAQNSPAKSAAPAKNGRSKGSP